MPKALVLNATEVPLSTVPARRAVVLAYNQKADVVHESGEFVNSEFLTLPVPSVIRLRYFVQVPYSAPRSVSRRIVFLRDNNVCQYCGAKADSIDHIIPRSRGGENTWDNVVAACNACNSKKRDRLLSETSLKLKKPPRLPNSFSSFVMLDAASIPKQWEPYLLKTA